jgi:large repetitive protein
MLHKYMRPARVLFLLVMFFLALPATIYALPQPTVTLTVPPDTFVGETVQFTVTFDNVGTTSGFGPFVDLIMPTRGADGADGISFVSAAIGPQAISDVTQRIFPASGCVTHPYAVGLNNAPTQICGTAGDTLTVLRLPFGSFATSQPPAVINVTAQTSPNADINLTLQIRARGGFQFGTDELNNPCCDPTIVTPAGPNVGGFPSAPITPIAFRVDKQLSSLETAVGENFVHTYIITADIPAGRTINNVVVTDTLAPTLLYRSHSVAPASCAVTVAGNLVTANCGIIVGGAGTDDVRLEIDFEVRNILSATLGTAQNINNSANMNGDFVTTDPGDPAQVSATGGAAAPVFAARSIAVQKNATIVGGGAPRPGAVVEYTLDFQVSDYFAFQNAVLCDRFTPAQVFDTSFTPTMSLTQHATVSATAAMNAANFTNPPAVPPTCGAGALLEFRVSDEMITRGIIASGLLLGGCIAEITPIQAPDCSLFNNGTFGRIVYRTILQQNYSSVPPSGNVNLDQGDILTNAASVRAALVPIGNSAPNGQLPTDTADVDVELPRGTLSKDIFAFNGSVSLPPIPFDIRPGDTVTFRLRYTVPRSDVEDLVLRDFLPIPIFDVQSTPAFTFVGGTPDASVPAINTIEYGPADTMNSFAAPVFNTDIAANALVFTYGDLSDAADTPREIDLLFTVQVQTGRPFAGSLALTNTADVSESSSQLQAANLSAFAGFNFLTPILVTHKGVVGSVGSGTITPPQTAPVVFGTPGTGGAPFSGVISTDGLGSIPLNSDVSFAQPGDLLRFALVIENIGNQGAFDITVRDILPAGFIIPASGLNLTVVRGDGVPITFTAVNASDTIPLFGAGIQLVDPGGNPVCQTRHPTDGSNIAVITYDLQVDPNVPIPSSLTNIAGLLRFTATDGGANNLVLDTAAFTNGATVGVGAGAGNSGEFLISDPRITKRGDPLFALPGEEVRWTIDIFNPSAIPMTNIRVTDVVQPYLSLISATATAGQISIDGQTVTLTLNTLSPNQTVTITIVTVVRGNPLPPPLGPSGTQAMCTPNGPLLTENISCLQYDGAAQICAKAQVVCRPSSLPNTGETPVTVDLWRMFASAMIVFSVGVLGVWRLRRNQLA